MDTSRTGTVAIVVRWSGKQPVLVDQFSDDAEIATFEAAQESGVEDPLTTVYERRSRLAREENDFGNYVEELLSQPCVRPEIQSHGVQWLKSRIKIESFQKCESEASRVIADYAFRVFSADPQRVDFLLAGPAAQVRIRVLIAPGDEAQAS